MHTVNIIFQFATTRRRRDLTPVQILCRSLFSRSISCAPSKINYTQLNKKKTSGVLSLGINAASFSCFHPKEKREKNAFFCSTPLDLIIAVNDHTAVILRIIQPASISCAPKATSQGGNLIKSLSSKSGDAECFRLCFV